MGDVFFLHLFFYFFFLINIFIMENFPKEFGYVILSNIVGSALTFFYMGGQVIGARKDAGVKLPKMYADNNTGKNKAFNGAQRGHHNGLESIGHFLALSIFAGLTYHVLRLFVVSFGTLEEFVTKLVIKIMDPKEDINLVDSFISQPISLFLAPVL